MSSYLPAAHQSTPSSGGLADRRSGAGGRFTNYAASAPGVPPLGVHSPSRSGNGSARWALRPEGEALRRALRFTHLFLFLSYMPINSFAISLDFSFIFVCRELP